jgi:restriction system protein
VLTLSPTEFEAYCEQLLVNSGWQSTTTKASGDQGIDILATRDGLKAVFQCKKQSSPVGNKAVQEAIAGKSFASADYAFVVSNADFTPSARELAAKSGVHLLHYSSLSCLDQYLES